MLVWCQEIPILTGVIKMEKMFQQHRNYTEINLAAIRHNGAIARKLFPEQKILSVLKADAYGHGITGVLPAYETFTDWYAVATVEEAERVRCGSEKPVLMFGPVPQARMVDCARMNLTFTVGSLDYAGRLSEVMQAAGLAAKCHLKIDTGLNRSGIRWRDPGISMKEILKILDLPNLEFTGTYTHLACGEGQLDWEVAHTALQMDRFYEACEYISKAGYDTGIRHCCSTGGALVNPQHRLDMVRLGMLPMGMSYTDESVDECDLIPALNWISFVAQVENVAAGDPVSYGCTFRAQRDMKVGIVTCGYADGYRRVYSNKSHVLVGGKRVPVIGRVAMDYLMIDLTDIADPRVGMEVTLLGSDGSNRVTALELSQYGEGVSGEVTCVISNRVPRIYTDKEL